MGRISGLVEGVSSGESLDNGPKVRGIGMDKGGGGFRVRVNIVFVKERIHDDERDSKSERNITIIKNPRKRLEIGMKYIYYKETKIKNVKRKWMS